MQSHWSDTLAKSFVEKYQKKWSKAVALRTYSSRLLGQNPALVLHGGGNTSVKDHCCDPLGNRIPALYVKASGSNLATIKPRGHVSLDLVYLRKLQALTHLTDKQMSDCLRIKRLWRKSGNASIESLMHAFITRKYVDHTHPDAILALTNRPDGDKIVQDVLGENVSLLEYVHPGFQLSKAAGNVFASATENRGIVLMKHGLVTWGDTARDSYEATIKLVDKAEKWLAKTSVQVCMLPGTPSMEQARQNYQTLAPRLRSALSTATGNPDRPWNRAILHHLVSDEILFFLNSTHGKAMANTPPLTADHLIRTKPFPLWLDTMDQLDDALKTYAVTYDHYFDAHANKKTHQKHRFDSIPRVILSPQFGAICMGHTNREATIVRDITNQTLKTKRLIADSGSDYEGLSDNHLFDMEYFGPQLAKLDQEKPPALFDRIALVTGAAGAIGSGLCRSLLEAGCHVAATDLAGPALDSLVSTLEEDHQGRIIGIALDVTDPDSVSAGFNRIIATWGGLDLVVINAGLAHVSTLADMDLKKFQLLEKVNVEGTLNLLSESGRFFKKQALGGDIVLISTKNVFCPGASFGAYSATKAGSHQLARIASLEMADMDVRVNMVSPDAVFSDGARKSGLWAEVGPDRMKARNLDEAGLEAYYQQRNLLKARVTAEHVGRAVLFFATRQTPTSGATIPVDGGLPDSTPR
ncbi:MAG: bifunctional aldolase/short-chain dehydrogenase [Magnetococcales bacterium]|nr:bifunctional aldolase/short-chain dehydrogenase [Magnetococcales bacterium]